VASGDHVYLTDFGLTKRMSDTRGMTATGMFVGTVDYIAPEQIEGRRVDARADVYALGCVLYEMLSGTVPFPRDSELAKLYAHVNDPPPPLQGVPASLAAAVTRAMAKQPADRFLSAGDFGRAAVAGAAGRTDYRRERTVAIQAAAIADATAPTELAGVVPSELAAARRGEPVQARGPEPRAPSAPPRPRRSWGVPAGAAALLAVIAAGVAIAIGASGSGKTTSTASSTPVSSTATTLTTTTTTTTPTTTTASANRATLAPATTPSSVDECQQQLTFAVDGTAGPLMCANGDLNVLAWQHYAQAAEHLLSVGSFASPDQVLQAMCDDKNSTVPVEQGAYKLAQAYYGWRFAVDPSTAYPSSCP